MVQFHEWDQKGAEVSFRAEGEGAAAVGPRWAQVRAYVHMASAASGNGYTAKKNLWLAHAS